MNAVEAYLLARAYTNKALEGAGALKGAACQIKSITSITGGHRVTFEWEDDEGETSTDYMDVMDGTDGDDGVGITSITYKETDVSGNYVYTVTLTDSNSYDIICPKGPAGATGNGIASIEKTSTSGLVDTYTITYTNGDTDSFTVTNGQNGVREFLGTSVEWEQLSTEEKKEYDTFQFKDDYSDANYIYLPTIYSEEEREVGVWKDGKPLYQKTIILSSVLYDTNWHDISHGISNIDSIKYVNGAVKNAESGSAEEFYDLTAYRPNSQTGLVVGATKTNIIYMNNWLEDATELWVTLQYTKTTDTAGSGTWTPTGQYAEHYSTDEQIIGTWIDGSTIYERTWDLGSDITGEANVWVDMRSYIPAIPNCNFIIDARAISSDGVLNQLDGAYNAGYLELRCSGASWNGEYITLKYTKETT